MVSSDWWNIEWYTKSGTEDLDCYFCAFIDLFRSATVGLDLLFEFIFLHFPKLEFGYDEIFGFS